MHSLLSLAAVTVTGLVTAWAVASPDSSNDPLGAIARGTAPILSAVADWYTRGPADGKPNWAVASQTVMGGSAARGEVVMAAHGCGTCHIIPGVARARGTVGPSLEAFAARSYVAGVVSNRPGELIDWLMDPVALSPNTAMPNLGLTDGEARDIAAYLYRLRR